MIHRVCQIALFIQFFFAVTSFPATTDVEKIWNQAQAKHIARDPYWLRLLHYRHPFESIGQWSLKSDVINPDFFLSPQGATDPHAELKATLTALFVPPDSNTDPHAQCRFIARFQWLMSKLDFSGTTLPRITCPSFQRWINIEKLRSIDLIFVSAYMDNPASIYGHILLKINSDDQYFGHSLLSPTINFGAIIDPDDNPVVYVFNGLFGGYVGRFSDERFYNYNHLYGENELRDLWEYPLRLTTEQQRRIVYHTWEMLQVVDFEYFFLLENCAYRMAQLVEMAFDEQRVNPEFAFWRMPLGVFHSAILIQNGEGPLLQEPLLIPSRQHRLLQKLSVLTAIQREWMIRILQDFKIVEFSEFQALTSQDKVPILDALIDYYQYQFVEKEDPLFQSFKQRILVLRSQQPMATPENFPSMVEPPTQGTPPTRARIGLFSNQITGYGLQLAAWTSYHDLLGREVGHVPNSQLVTLDLRLRVNQDSAERDRVYVESLTFFNIQSLNTGLNELPGESGWSWHTRGAVERAHLGCLPCRVLYLSAGFGKTFSWSTKEVWFAFMDGFLTTPSANVNETSFGLAPNVGILFEPTSHWKFLLEGRMQQNASGPDIKEIQLRWEHRWIVSPLLDMRLEWTKSKGSRVEAHSTASLSHEVEEMILALNYYW